MLSSMTCMFLTDDNERPLGIICSERKQLSAKEVANIIRGSIEYTVDMNSKYIIIRKDGICYYIDNNFICYELDYIHKDIDFDYEDSDYCNSMSSRIWLLFNGINYFSDNDLFINLIKENSKRTFITEYEHKDQSDIVNIELAFELEYDNSCSVIDIVKFMDNDNITIRYALFSYENLDRYFDLSESNVKHSISSVNIKNRSEIEFSSISDFTKF